MKKITYLLSVSALFISGQFFAQENTISENGNVGLGTGSTAPTARLTVAGSTRIDSTLTVNDSVVMASNALVGEDLKVEGDLYLPNIAQLDGLNGETILASGENGITKKLAVGTLRDIIYSRNCDLAGGTVTSPTWANGPNKLFSECPQVLVGIGTSTPTRQLDVVGEAKVSSNLWAQGSISIGSDLNTFSKLSIVNTNRTAAIQSNTVGNTKPYQRLMYFEYDNADTKIMEVVNTATSRTPFLLQANGAMDIDNGTTTIFHLGTEGSLELRSGSLQTFKVETTGLIRGRRMKLDLDTWADYVFEPTYHLMPLSEVESFVKKEKHLPNVPSEQELKVDGADVMEMNKILMEKVEELTLYLIQQNKNTEVLKQQVEVLQAKLAELEKTQN
ncbi:hypothetical protein [Fluviicola chungangensis]|uniref:Peptidase S74 domain-containing protein n=1 Tax=Fluviicola chungangensis TaxID=2597671 RepID=A0A556N5W2_9FLAO|nr:hypothetical protein [Fluviicola chungangensis]TSJ47576.1 hypothetical protein FO442_00165 [Fluviicola chungangensis]